MTRNSCLRPALFLLLPFCFALQAKAQAPDLTNGDLPSDLTGIYEWSPNLTDW